MENNNIEDGIIGCILLDPNCLYEVYNKIKPEMFTSNFCKRVYETALSLYDRGKKFDATILANELASAESSSEVYQKQFGNLIMNTPSSVYLKGYTDKLIANYQSKRLNLLIKDIDTNPTEINNTIGTLITRLEEIQSNEREKSHTMAEIVEANQSNYFTDKKSESGIKTGLDKLDEILGDLEGGDITVIGARPSVGKSALATQIARYLSSKGKKVGYFNLEMRESQIYERMLASESKVSLVRIRKALNYLGDEKAKIDAANDVLKKLNIVISAGGKTDLDIKAESRHQNFDIIIIDYLQLVRYSKRCESRRVEVGEVSRSLKNLAMELNTHIILLSQLSRKSEYKQDKEPTMDELRETGDIEQDASNILLMWNLSDDPNNKSYKGLKVDKCRQSELMSECLQFMGDKMTFVESDESLNEIKKKLKEFKPVSDNDDSPFIN